jgi:hypothetical protein
MFFENYFQQLIDYLDDHLMQVDWVVLLIYVMYYEDINVMMEMLYLLEIQLMVLLMLVYFHQRIYFVDHQVNHVNLNQRQLKKKKNRCFIFITNMNE